MEAIALKAEARTQFGKGPARKLRAEGRIPALVYRAGNEPTHLAIDPTELRLAFARSGNPNLVLALDVDGDKTLAILTDTQKHPVSRALLHADFYEIREDEKVVVEVPVEAFGKARGMILGGKLQKLRRTVPVLCLPKDIPAKLPVDIKDMDLGDFIRASQVKLPEGCELKLDHDYNVFSLAGRRIAAEFADEEDEEEGEGEGETASEATE